MANRDQRRGNQRTIVSLFSGALGLDLGLEDAGFKLRVAVENNAFAAETIRANRPELPLIEDRIENVSTAEILKRACLEIGEPTLVTAGPCCQSFSTVGLRKSVADPRGGLFREFIRVVKEARPRFFVMENVRGILSAAVKHRRLDQRGPGNPHLDADEELGSALILLLKELESTGYFVIFDLLNTADFGVPQTRERVVFLGSRDGELICMPRRSHSRNPTGKLKPWVSLKEGLKGLCDTRPKFTPLTPIKQEYLSQIPAGANWRALPKEIQPKAIGSAFNSWGGRSGFLRRLSWTKPSPALTTAPDGKATMLCHPAKLRPLSVREYARLQQFPSTWKFAGGVPQKYKQIGNAVPLGLGTAIGRILLGTMQKRNGVVCAPGVTCLNQDLLDRIALRPKTIMNPLRMRKIKTTSAAIGWLNGLDRGRSEILAYGKDAKRADQSSAEI